MFVNAYRPEGFDQILGIPNGFQYRDVDGNLCYWNGNSGNGRVQWSWNMQYYSISNIVSKPNSGNTGSIRIFFGNSNQAPAISDYSIIGTIQNNMTMSVSKDFSETNKIIITITLTATGDNTIREMCIAATFPDTGSYGRCATFIREVFPSDLVLHNGDIAQIKLTISNTYT